MVSSNMLLQLIMRLQRGVSVTEGRRILLDYARKSSAAECGWLFLVDREREGLRLLEQSPHDVTSSCSDDRLLPLHGIFGSVLHARHLVHIPDISEDRRSLKEEQEWAGQDSYVILSRVGSAERRGYAEGVLVLCFRPSNSEAQRGTTKVALKNGVTYDATRE